MATVSKSKAVESVPFRVSDKHPEIKMRLFAGPQRVVNGLTAFTLPVTLPRNAVVRTFDLVATASRAGATAIDQVAQFRVADATASDLANQGVSIVVDFGSPRTVGAVQVPTGLSIVRVTPWIGAAFAPSPVYRASVRASAIVSQPPSTDQFAALPSEIRTERLLIELLGIPSDEQLSEIAVLLPEPPGDLELRIDGGAPVWKAPGPAQTGPGAAVTADDWNDKNQRLIPLGPALAALTGDPTATSDVTFELVLSSRVPGLLDLKVQTREIDVVRRLTFDGDTVRELTFDTEGALDVPILLPPPPAGAPRIFRSVRFTAVGKPDIVRVLPPVGPAPGTQVDLVLDSGRAALVRLLPAHPLQDLTGIRLPLRPGSAGAEARVVLWNNREPAPPQSGTPNPIEPVSPFGPEGTSDPVTLPPGDTETWVTFPFKKPVKIAPDNLPWAALVVSRGEVSWTLGESSIPEHHHAATLRLGPPAGPWKRLPPPFFAPGSPLQQVIGRCRAAGTAPKEKPVAPALVHFVQSNAPPTPPLPVVPTPKGAPFTATLALPFTENPALRVVSHLPGTLTLRDVDVTSST